MKKINQITLLITLLLLLFGCNMSDDFEVKDFIPISSFLENDTVKYTVDLNNALANGVVIPTKNGNQDYFKVQFKIMNKSKKAERYYYKLFYQNESYAHELYVDRKSKIRNPKANNNFYGSWNVEKSGFHITEIINPNDSFIQITDSFSIIGNPRDEKVFFGGEFNSLPITEEEIQATISRIKNSDDWVKQIQNKAIKNDMPFEKQIYIDAVWCINYNNNNGNYNNRWKRNPRTGLYNFLLVVVKANYLDKIPLCYQDVTIKDSLTGTYQNPYQYYLDLKASDVISEIAHQKLKIGVKYELNKGVYTGNISKNSDSILHYAQFEQYFHTYNKKKVMNNIPVITDIFVNDYTLEDYKNNAVRFKDSELISDYLRISDSPGETVGYDKQAKAIVLKNPGNKFLKEFKKENVGIETRHGFTYGKYIAKIRFPKILNTNYVWNGLTCAVWLKYQSGDWNKRSNCVSGFNPKLASDTAKSNTSVYSEIDIEIVKTSKYWPKTSYGLNKKYPIDDALNNNVILSCTNWDLACHDPDSFNTGVRESTYKDKSFALHRWDDKYRALTSKYEYTQDSVLGREYYFVIEWYPTHIVWKIGPSKDNLIVIGYMDDKSTMIPDNQMQMVITQEYHLSEWWPLTPFKQEFIPYPLNDIVGYIYELEIE